MEGSTKAILAILALLFLAGCGEKPKGDQSAASKAPTDDFDTHANLPPTPRTLYAMARVYAAQGKDAQCEAVLLKVVREHPDFLPAYCDLAECQMRQHGPDRAMQTLAAGLAVSPQDPVLINNVGMCWMLKGEYEKALAQFTEAASDSPLEAKYRANMATALGMMGRYDESLTLFQQVLGPSDAHYNLYIICEARKDTTRAAQEYLQSVQPKLTGEPGSTTKPASSTSPAR